MVGHAIDVEEHRAGDVTGQIFLVRFPIGRRQEPAAVEDDDLWIAEMLGEPVGGARAFIEIVRAGLGIERMLGGEDELAIGRQRAVAGMG